MCYLTETIFDNERTIEFSYLINRGDFIATVNKCYLLLDEQNTKRHWNKDDRIWFNMGPAENALGLNPDNIWQLKIFSTLNVSS